MWEVSICIWLLIALYYVIQGFLVMCPPNLVYFRLYPRAEPVKFNIDEIRPIQIGSHENGIFFPHVQLTDIHIEYVQPKPEDYDLHFMALPSSYYSITFQFKSRSSDEECLIVS